MNLEIKVEQTVISELTPDIIIGAKNNIIIDNCPIEITPTHPKA